MEKRFELNVNQILNKEFHVDIKGYNAHEVDKFLDLVISDYQKYDEVLQVLTNTIKQYETENANLRNQVQALAVQNESVKQTTQQVDQLDVLKRLSNLEQEVFKNK